MYMSKQVTFSDLMTQFKRHDSDSGSPEVQIIMFSYTIAYLTRHLNDFPKDNSAKLALTKLVHRRRKTLEYLKHTNKNVCANIVSAIGLRFKV